MTEPAGEVPTANSQIWRRSRFRQEARNLLPELGPDRVVLEQQVVAALQSDEARSRDPRGDLAAPAEGHARIVTGVKDERRGLYEREPVAHVDRAERLHQAGGDRRWWSCAAAR